MTGKIRIGISGWRYPPWRGVFYPKTLPQRRELEFAAAHFDTIEINGTFYSLQRPQHFREWAGQTPPDFVFAVKGPRYLTHMLKLNKPLTPLANFFASGVLALGRKLGPVLWQFPPQFVFHPEKLEAFFALLPHSTTAAAALATKHDARLRGRCLTRAECDQPLRHAIEIRHDSFRDPAFIALLRRHGIGLVVADTCAWPRLMDVTSDFVYCRLHGSTQLYASGYGPKALERWALRIRAWAGGREAEGQHAGPPAQPGRPRDVFVFFDNDMKVRAPRDAEALIRRLRRDAPA